MLRKLWLTFSQTATVCIAVLFVVSTLHPEWLARRAETTSATALSSVLEVESGAPVSVSRHEALTSYAEAARRAMPAVVNINTSKEVNLHAPTGEDEVLRRFFGDQPGGGGRQQIASLGSGVIVSPKGYILTNNHVVESADDIEVALADGRKANAKVVGSDPETDLAVVRIELANLPTITFGQSDRAQVGDVVLAIGNPFAVGQTVTMGIVSALGRNHLGINTFENFIQTDAAINPGNSGGALVDASGNLIGINTAIYSNSHAGGSLGIGFAIPASTAKQVMESIIATGQVVRGYIGVEPQEITPEMVEALKLPRTRGALITGVMRNGPADKAGLKPGDILVGVDETQIDDTTTMLNHIAQLRPGSTSRLSIVRGSQELALSVKIGRRPKPQPTSDN
ncbi:MAG: trypsin-like peptidase domain-containing protein [Burkholderiaceae bacterium]|jgi:serine protease DegQ